MLTPAQSSKRPQSHQWLSGMGESGNIADGEHSTGGRTQELLAPSAQQYGCGLGHAPHQFPHITRTTVSIAFVKYSQLSG